MKRIITFITLLISVVFVIHAQTVMGIKVSTAFGGTLFLDGKRVATLLDNDSFTIPIGKAGTYSVRIKFPNGKEAAKTVVISARGITEIGFLLPPKNLQIGAAGIDTLPLYWDSSGTGVTYNVYYNTVSHLDTAKSVKNIAGTSTTLQDLEWNNTYYVWLSVTEGGMEGIKSGVISKELVKTKLGQTGPGGGIIFYDKGIFNEGWQYLEAAPASTEFKIAWGPNNNVAGTKTEVGTGKRNTQILVDYLRKIGESGAARLCTSLNYGSVNDWFLPSKDELNLMYKNIKLKGWGGFSNGWYWSSSQDTNSTAWNQSFGDGFQYGNSKSITSSVRAVRAF